MWIEARHLTVRYGARAALEGVGCALAPGAMTGLIGPNGAGKTTLLRALAGLIAPAEGEIRYGDAPISAMAPRERARRVSYLAQGGAADWPLSVEATVALGRLPHRGAFAGLSRRDREAIERALADADLQELRNRPLGELSGGERARALMARALAVGAEWLLADEPIAALDPLHQLSAMTLLRAQAQRGAGVVVVLHDLTLAARFCDRLIALAGGRIIADCAPEDITADALAEAYGVDVLRGEHRGEPFLLPWSIRAK